MERRTTGGIRPTCRREDHSSPLNGADAWAEIEQTIQHLNDAEIHWFMIRSFPSRRSTPHGPVFALEHSVPALQLNYAVGMSGQKPGSDYLRGLITVMQHHKRPIKHSYELEQCV